MVLGSRTLPDQVADYLIAKIFIGELMPGDRLPPERLLATQLGVDRTSLRMALRHLSRLGVLKSVHGSGITIEDYREKGGIDFLADVFSMEELDLGGKFLLEALDQWCFFMPLMIMSAARNTPQNPIDPQPVLAALQQQCDLLQQPQPDMAAVVELELALHASLNREIGSTIMRMINNSTHVLRRRIVSLLFSVIDVTAHVQFHQQLVSQVLAGEFSGWAVMDYYRDYLARLTEPLRQHLHTLPQEPTLKSSPL